MIVRILGEGQFDVPDERIERFNEVDERLVGAVEAGDEHTYRQALAALLDAVRTGGARVPDDYLGPSDLILPAPDTSLDELKELLGDDGLIPG